VVDDACATVSEELHNASLGVLKFRYANVATTKEVMNEVRRGTFRPQEER
jgi:isochorismate hydrolase